MLGTRMREGRRGIRTWSAVAVGAIAVLSVSCARHRPVINYAAYERTPNRPASMIWRLLAKSNPITSRASFYGNYGGPGNLGGKPLDEMDELFRRHDIVYHLSDTRKVMEVADEELIEGLQSLDTRRLAPQGERYRQRAISFFSSPVSLVVGKPLSTLYRCREAPDGYFQSPEVVREFFSKEHPGFPGDAGQLAAANRRTLDGGNRR